MRLLTELDAAALVCPLSMGVQGGTQPRKCVASMCAVWEWAKSARDHDIDTVLSLGGEYSAGPDLGCCGLARR